MNDSESLKLHKHRFFLLSRMLLLQFLALTIVVTVVGLAGMKFFKQHCSNEIESNCASFSDAIDMQLRVRDINISSDTFLATDAHIENTFDVASMQMDSDIFIFSQDGKCVYCSENSGKDPKNVKIPKAVFHDIKNDGYYNSDKHGLMYLGTSSYTMGRGVKLTAPEKDGSETVYYLILNSRSQELENFTRVTDISSLIVVIAIVVLYAFSIYRFVTRYAAAPKADFIRVLRSYAKGDYSEKLDPDTYKSEYDQDYVRYLNEIIANLSTVSDQQSQFVSNVSHELRTPMTIISGYINGILDGTVPKERRTEYLYIVSQEMQRLKILVSSMLNLTKYDNGTIQVNKSLFAINDLIFRTFLMFQTRIENRGINIEGIDSDTLYVYGDSDLIGQVVYNLVENAVKFVDTNGTITIRLEETKEHSVFAIRNTGPGISKEELPKIFGRFYKSDFSRSQDKTGLGLGLDIIRKILILHDAQISVSSEENVFTEFLILFPKKPDDKEKDKDKEKESE